MGILTPWFQELPRLASRMVLLASAYCSLDRAAIWFPAPTVTVTHGRAIARPVRRASGDLSDRMSKKAETGRGLFHESNQARLVLPALRAAAHRFFIASAILFRAAGLILRRVRGADACAAEDVEVCALLGGRPRLFGAVAPLTDASPSMERTAAICSSIVFFCASRPVSAAVSMSRDTARCIGIRPIIHESVSD